MIDRWPPHDMKVSLVIGHDEAVRIMDGQMHDSLEFLLEILEGVPGNGPKQLEVVSSPSN